MNERIESKMYLTSIGPENFTDYDFADEAQAEIDEVIETLNSISEHHEPKMYAGLTEDLLNSLEALEAHLK